MLRWAMALLRRIAPADRVEDVLGDLEEAHRARRRRHGRVLAGILTGLESLDMAQALMRDRTTSRRTSVAGVSWLDFKLGFRMLVRYPGLTLVGGLAMAFAIWVGAGAFEFVTQIVHPRLPLEDGDRIVGIQLWDAATGRPEPRALHDFAAWREELSTIRDAGAFRTIERNLITHDERGQPVEVAEISVSAFRLARVPPLHGRTLVDADERPRAPPVAVIGHRIWQTRFDGDPNVVGSTVRLGRSSVTIVGIMPEGFRFPVSHGFWMPLRASLLEQTPRGGPGVRVFGRLADGVPIDAARAELAAWGRRAAADFPETHEHLRPRVLPYAQFILNLGTMESVALLSGNLFIVMLLVLVCANVALLLFARAATREGEIIVRNALGASRARIIGQLFAEALVLGTFAAMLGLAAAGFGLRWAFSVYADIMAGGTLPFWFRPQLAPATVLYAIALTVLGAAVAGVIPGIKVTRGLHARLRENSAGGGGLRFGGVWTAVIVAQVAVTVAFPYATWLNRKDKAEAESIDVGFPSEQYLTARLEMDPETDANRTALGGNVEGSGPPLVERLATVYRQLEGRLAAEPAVAGWTYADRLPRMYHPHRRIELDEGGAGPIDPRFGYRRVSSESVDPAFFRTLDIPILAGRDFDSGDLGADRRAVIVNESFVRRILGGHNPIGRRLRYTYFEELEAHEQADEPSPWYEIVGVVRDMGLASEWDQKSAGIYHPVTPEAVYPLSLAVRVRGEPEAFATRLRRIATQLDPSLRLHAVQRLDRVNESSVRFGEFWFRLTLGVSLMALVLSLAGIYAVMSFTVSRRTREIGIRVALGADSGRIVMGTLRRPFVQIVLGIIAGAALTAALARVVAGEVTGRGVLMVIIYAIAMLAVCLFACIVPVRRALRIQPAEAIMGDG